MVSVLQPPPPVVMITAAMLLLLFIVRPETAQALRITHFRVPNYVPITLASSQQLAGQPPPSTSQRAHHPLDLAKPILLDCDYDYDPNEDTKLAVRWFRNREPEPFYQWLPELGVQHFADWIQPLVNQSFVSDPHDPLKRYRSLLIRRLSMNLTGVYSCDVSSLASQDQRHASLTVYQPPRELDFRHHLYPLAANWLAPSSAAAQMASRQRSNQQLGGEQAAVFRPLPARNPLGPIVRPPNNPTTPGASAAERLNATSGHKIRYTHDGRPVRQRREPAPTTSHSTSGQVSSSSNKEPQHLVLMLYLQCQASQVTPKPVMLLNVRRGPDSIAQYLHESTSTNLRDFQVAHSDYYEHLAAIPSSLVGSSSNNNNNNNNRTSLHAAPPLAPGGHLSRPNSINELMVTLYDISALSTVFLNVSLATPPPHLAATHTSNQTQPGIRPPPPPTNGELPHLLAGQVTVLPFRRGQRMLFECHLELTGTEFDRRKQIKIDEQEVYRVVETELQNRRRLHQMGGPTDRRTGDTQWNSGHVDLAQQGERRGGVMSSLGFSASSATAAVQASLLPMMPLICMSILYQHTLGSACLQSASFDIH